jgi:hypothetical protein
VQHDAVSHSSSDNLQTQVALVSSFLNSWKGSEGRCLDSADLCPYMANHLRLCDSKEASWWWVTWPLIVTGASPASMPFGFQCCNRLTALSTLFTPGCQSSAPTAADSVGVHQVGGWPPVPTAGVAGEGRVIAWDIPSIFCVSATVDPI